MNWVLTHDDRTSFLSTYTVEAVSAARNTEAGFWIASNRPGATDYAITGSVHEDGATRAALVTDGITRLVERYGRSWSDLFDRLDKTGPAQLLADVRGEERATAPVTYRGKTYDAATAAFCRF